MLSTGIAIVALAIIGIIYGLMQKMKAGRVANAPLARTGDAASKGKSVAASNGAIAVEGQVLCPQPVIAPVSGLPCLFYEVKCMASWKDGDTTKSKEAVHQRVGAQLAVDDGSGPVGINLAEGGDFEPEQVKEESRGAGLGGVVGKGVTFGSLTVSSAPFPIGTKYTVRETILPVVPKLYVCGKVGDAGSPISAPSFRSLIVSNKSRDELLGAAAKNAKRFLIGGAIAFAAGSGLALVGQLTSPKPAEESPNSVTVTSNAMPATATPASSSTSEADDKQPSAPKAATGARTATTGESASASHLKAASSAKPAAQPTPPTSQTKTQKAPPAKK